MEDSVCEGLAGIQAARPVGPGCQLGVGIGYWGVRSRPGSVDLGMQDQIPEKARGRSKRCSPGAG